MSKRLEDFIKANREEFDDLHPQTDLWKRIEEQLPVEFELKKTEKKTFSLGFVMRVAATVIVIMSISFVLYLRNEKSHNGVNLTTINPEYAKEEVHYTALISTKLIELKKISKSDPQLYKQFTVEIAKMDSTYKKLSSDLPTSPNQDLVLRAMIKNLQIQTEALNQQLMIIEQFNQMKKEQPNEAKDI